MFLPTQWMLLYGVSVCMFMSTPLVPFWFC